MEALRFYMSRKCGEKGVLQEENTLHGELKKLTFLVRWQLLDAVQEDLQVLLPAPPLTLSLPISSSFHFMINDLPIYNLRFDIHALVPPPLFFYSMCDIL